MSASVAYELGRFIDGMEALRAGRRLIELARIKPVSVTVEIAIDVHAGPARYAWLPGGTTLTATYPAALASQVGALVEGRPDVLFEPIPFDNADYMLRLALDCSVVPMLRHVPSAGAWISGTYPAGTVEQRLVEVAIHDRAQLQWFGCHWPGSPDGLNGVILRVNSGQSYEGEQADGHELELHVGAWYDEDGCAVAEEDARCDAVAARLASDAGLSVAARGRGWG